MGNSKPAGEPCILIVLVIPAEKMAAVFGAKCDEIGGIAAIIPPIL